VRQRALNVNRSLADALEEDARSGNTNWGQMQEKVEKAEKIRDLAQQLAGVSPDDLNSSSARSKVKELEKLAGGRRQARQAIENANLSGGAKASVLRRFLGGW
jgi:hypothetical protein